MTLWMLKDLLRNSEGLTLAKGSKHRHVPSWAENVFVRPHLSVIVLIKQPLGTEIPYHAFEEEGCESPWIHVM